MTLALIVPILLLVVGIAFVAWDEFIKHIFRHYHAEWIKAGEPIGITWTPPAISIFDLRRATARGKKFYCWLLKTPSFTADDPKALRLLRLMRIALTLGVVMFIFLGKAIL